MVKGSEKGTLAMKPQLSSNGCQYPKIATSSLAPQVCSLQGLSLRPPAVLLLPQLESHRTTGAAQNNGGMASSSKVVSKDQGFSMLAKHLTNVCGYDFDKKQAQNKFTYLERKFHDAKTWQRTSGNGITADDKAKGLCLFFS